AVPNLHDPIEGNWIDLQVRSMMKSVHTIHVTYQVVSEHLAAEEIKKLVEDPKNVDDSSPPRHDDTSIPGTRLELMSNKDSPEVEIVQEKEEETAKDTKVEPDKDTPMVDVTNIVPPVNVD
ncbi:hypothetical protein Tco_0147581, partial [Tanacetum coccineum]